jgi:hypothetical protein
VAAALPAGSLAAAALGSWGHSSAGLAAGYGAQPLVLGLQQVASTALLAPPQLQNYSTLALVASWSMDPVGLVAAVKGTGSMQPAGSLARRLLEAVHDVEGNATSPQESETYSSSMSSYGDDRRGPLVSV